MKANCGVVAPKVGGASAADGSLIEADFQLVGAPSVLFDTVFVAISEKGAEMLSAEAAAVAWLHDAFAHCKVIGATRDAQPLLDKAGVVSDEGVLLGTALDTFLTRASNDGYGTAKLKSKQSIST